KVEAGKVGVAIAVAVEDGLTEAQLAGTVSAGGAITVNAETTREGISGSYFKFIPKSSNGVTAAAGTAAGGPANVIDGLEKSSKDLAKSPLVLLDPVKDKLKAYASGLFSGDEEKATETATSGESLDLAAAVAVMVDTNVAEARLGLEDGRDRQGDVVSDRSVIDAQDGVEVTAVSAHRPKVNASGSAAKDDSAGQPSGDNPLKSWLKTKVVDKQGSSGTADGSAKDKKQDNNDENKEDETAAVAISGAVSVGVLNNEATAMIEGNVDLDAGQSIVVDAQSLNEIALGSLFGANMITAIEDLASGKVATDFQSSDTGENDDAVRVDKGDRVLVDDGHTAGGEAGNVYEFLGDNSTSLVLADEDFSDSGRWNKVGTPLEEQIPQLIATLGSYLSGNFGLNGSFDSWTQATASGEKLALAASVDVFVLNQHADARIREGARINVDGDANVDAAEMQDLTAGDGQAIRINADTVNDLFNLVGNIKLPGLGAADSFNAEKWKSAIFSKPSLDSTVGTKAEGVAIGASLAANVLGSHTHAEVESGVTLLADSLDVTADSRSLLLGVGASGGKADKVAINASGIANVVQNTTHAGLGDDGVIKVGDGHIDEDDANSPALRVSANDESYLINLTGSLSASGKAAIGAAAGISVLDRDTQAWIGQRDADNINALAGSLTVGGNVDVLANNAGVVVDLAVAGSVVTKDSESGGGQSGGSSGDDPGKWPNNQAKYDNVIAELQGNLGQSSGGGGQQESVGVGVSGSAVVHVGNDDTLAAIRGLADFHAAGDVQVAANDATQLGMLAGGAAYSSSSKSVAVAGGAAIAVQGGDTRAEVMDIGAWSSNALRIESAREGWSVLAAAGVAVATGKKGAGVAGSASALVSQRSVNASLLRIDEGDLGELGISATDAANTILVSGAVAAGGNAGVGASAAVSYLSHDVSARVEDLGSADERLTAERVEVLAD
ncbi:MAG: hypothetical protein ACOC0M_09770, partial [Halomonas sp.]